MSVKKMTRREALKAILATAGGLAVLSGLPARWVNPVVNSGVLPRQCQTSDL